MANLLHEPFDVLLGIALPHSDNLGRFRLEGTRPVIDVRLRRPNGISKGQRIHLGRTATTLDATGGTRAEQAAGLRLGDLVASGNLGTRKRRRWEVAASRCAALLAHCRTCAQRGKTISSIRLESIAASYESLCSFGYSWGATS